MTATSLAGLRDLESALPTGNNRAEEPKPGCSEAKTGCLGSCTISTQETHHLHQPASHPRFRTGEKSEKRVALGLCATAYPLDHSLK
jgi:hypothetical protein